MFLGAETDLTVKRIQQTKPTKQQAFCIFGSTNEPLAWTLTNIFVQVNTY